jgi:hypothetical protein
MKLFAYKHRNFFAAAANVAALAAPAVAFGADSAQLENPLKFDSVCGLIGGVLDAVMVIGIPIAVLFMVWAGLKFVLAQGNAEALASARKNFLNVIIGIAIFVGASLIAQVIVNTVAQLGVNGINSC